MERHAERVGWTSPPVVVLTLIVVVAAGWTLSSIVDNESATRLSDVAKNRDDAKGAESGSQATARFEVEIRPGPPIPRIGLGIKDQHGETITAACNTCHSTRPANKQTRRASDLNEFHQGLAFSHNNLSCLSCHNPEDYDTLRLADGTTVEYSDVMTLCAQCHGPQSRDYEHGAHGGMTGYWDLSRGPRLRNNCVDCHHPHLPQFPKMQPTFKPRDRFLEKATEHGTRTHE